MGALKCEFQNDKTFNCKDVAPILSDKDHI